jgi:Heavy metal binding domain
MPRLNLLRPTLLLLLVCMAARASYGQQQQTVAQLAGKIDTELAATLSASSSSEKKELSNSLVQQLSALKEQSVMVFGSRRQQLKEKVQQLGQLCKELFSAESDEAARAAAERAQRLWPKIKSLYPKEALQILPPLWSCPMHQDLMKTAAGNCPTCGMPLEPIYVTQPQLTQSAIIRAEIVTDKPLEVGKRADLRIRLVFVEDSQPVALSDLEETHTRKIHLLISDITETDYHHEHPEPVGNGEYAFSFTPQRPDTYRVWADLLPARTHVQQYSVADIPSSTPRQAKLADNEPENRHAEIDGYTFDLSFENERIRERDTVAGKLRVTQPDGQPCNKLDVVMGAFGHFVGFGDDSGTVLHLHPVGPLITDPQARGGPELPFYFRSNKPGLFRLFAQVKIDGKDFFPRFVLQVQPLQRLSSL